MKATSAGIARPIQISTFDDHSRWVPWYWVDNLDFGLRITNIKNVNFMRPADLSIIMALFCWRFRSSLGCGEGCLNCKRHRVLELTPCPEPWISHGLPLFGSHPTSFLPPLFDLFALVLRFAIALRQ